MTSPFPDDPLDPMRPWRIASAVGLILLMAKVFDTAWVGDDAYITFRSIKNLYAGQGLTWNPGERVQVFTHPLWMLLMALVRGVTGSFFGGVLGLGITLTGATALLLMRSARSAVVGCVAVFFLFSSQALTDYATGGLENPLSHLLLLGLIVLDDREDRRSQHTLFALLVALLLLNRLDGLLLVLPAWAARTWSARSLKTALAVAAGLTPLIAWELFSLVYFGDFLPNTAAAKLGSGLPALDMAQQGVLYLGNSLTQDPSTIAAVLGVGGWLLWHRGRGVDVTRHGLWILGALLHLVYVAKVGGDFMAGRFLTPAFVVAVIVLARTPAPVSRSAAAALVALLALLGAWRWDTPFAPADCDDGLVSSLDWVDAHGISDERRFYGCSGSLRASHGAPVWPGPLAALEADAMRTGWRSDLWLRGLGAGTLAGGDLWPPPSSTTPDGRPLKPVIVRGGVGFLGFHLGSDVHVLDVLALGDPLLARLPSTPPDPALLRLTPELAEKGWRVGHYFRRPPIGYALTLSTGDPYIQDPSLAAYYAAVQTLVTGPIWSGERLATIARFHVGAYDHLLPAAD